MFCLITTWQKKKYEELGIEYSLADTPPLSRAEAIEAKNIIMNGLKKALKQKLANEQN